MGEPCYCGAPDCPQCFPGCLDRFECAACGHEVHRYEMADDKICVDCQKDGFGECRICGKIEILVDFKQCADCWLEELKEALA